MNAEIVTLILLAILIVGSNAFWAYTCMQLTNRLMSRNYFEYTQGKVNLKPLRPQTRKQPNEDELVVDPEDDRQARDMNSLMGIV